jgi:hypothetical protein
VIPQHCEPKGLAPNTVGLADPLRRSRREAARRGSKLLRNAILCAKGLEPPVEAKPHSSKPAAPKPPLRKSVAPQLCPTCCAPVSPRRLFIADIQQMVASYYGLPLSAMTSESRVRKITHARQVAMYLASEITRNSVAEIGRRFNRDHTTVLHAMREINQRSEKDPEIAFDVALLRERLTA